MESSKDRHRPHAVAVPLPTQGHINPMMQFCRALARRGFTITFVNTESNQARMQNLEQDNGLDIRYETVPDSLPIPIADFNIFYQDNRLKLLQVVDSISSQVEGMLERIAASGPPISCLISEFLKASVGQRLGIPTVVFRAAGISPMLLEYHIPLLAENGDIPVEDPSSDQLVTSIPGLSPIPTWSLPHGFQAKEAAYDPGFARRLARNQTIKEADFVVVNSAEELEPEALDALRAAYPKTKTYTVGPLVLLDNEAGLRMGSPSLWEENRECIAWLDSHSKDSVLYVSFGSIASLAKEQIEELAAGLEQIDQPYLWVLRPITGSRMSQAEFDALGSRVRASKGLLVPWVPQLEVLNHPATGGFVTHCGWNSTMEGICAGVPLLCWPCIAEQNLNCKMVVQDWKIGLKFSNVTCPQKDEFVQLVRKLFGEAGYELRNNVRLLKQTLHAAVSNEGSTQKNLDKLIAGLLERAPVQQV